MSFAKKFKKIVKQTVRDAPKAFTDLGRMGALPLNVAAGSISGGLDAAAPVLTQATGLLQANPLLGQALGAAVPGLGGFLSMAGPGQQAVQAYDMPQAAPSYDGGGGGGGGGLGGIPLWGIVAAIGAAILGLFLVLRRH